MGNSGDFSLKQRLSNYDGIPPEHYGCGYKLQQCSTRDVSVENGSRSIFSGMSGRRKPYVSPRLDPAWGRSLLLWKLCSSQLWSTLQLNVGVGYVTRVLLNASFQHCFDFSIIFKKIQSSERTMFFKNLKLIAKAFCYSSVPKTWKYYSYKELHATRLGGHLPKGPNISGNCFVSPYHRKVLESDGKIFLVQIIC